MRMLWSFAKRLIILVYFYVTKWGFLLDKMFEIEKILIQGGSVKILRIIGLVCTCWFLCNMALSYWISCDLMILLTCFYINHNKAKKAA